MSDAPKDCPKCGMECVSNHHVEPTRFACGSFLEYWEGRDEPVLTFTDRCRIRELEAAALATDAQIADLKGRLAEAERQLRNAHMPQSWDVY